MTATVVVTDNTSTAYPAALKVSIEKVPVGWVVEGLLKLEYVINIAVPAVAAVAIVTFMTLEDTEQEAEFDW